MEVVARYLIRHQPLLVQHLVDYLLHKSVAAQPIVRINTLYLINGSLQCCSLPLAPNELWLHSEPC